MVKDYNKMSKEDLAQAWEITVRDINRLSKKANFEEWYDVEETRLGWEGTVSMKKWDSDFKKRLPKDHAKQQTLKKKKDRIQSIWKKKYPKDMIHSKRCSEDTKYGISIISGGDNIKPTVSWGLQKRKREQKRNMSKSGKEWAKGFGKKKEKTPEGTINTGGSFTFDYKPKDKMSLFYTGEKHPDLFMVNARLRYLYNRLATKQMTMTKRNRIGSIAERVSKRKRQIKNEIRESGEKVY